MGDEIRELVFPGGERVDLVAACRLREDAPVTHPNIAGRTRLRSLTVFADDLRQDPLFLRLFRHDYLFLIRASKASPELNFVSRADRSEWNSA